MRKPSKITISKDHLDFLLKESKKSSEEVGALLFGKFEVDKTVVELVKMLRYSERSTTHFMADPLFLLESFSEAEKKGLELVGIFHSHPAPPRPSSLDMKYMELNPIVWLIADSISLVLRVYRLDAGELKEVEIEIVDIN
ncbi:MAG TPA: M67 family peptidase [Candidatus Korarchaeota archaeon]|nr:M67 family peptidase [Candidatus Korarchaeota archaeon]